jgi:hypothetical protein
VGRAEGRNDGSIVGDAEGKVVGKAVGIVVGRDVVGLAEGIGVGDCVRLNLLAIKRPVHDALPAQPW